MTNNKETKTREPKSLYTEIIDFMEDHLKGIPENKHYPKGNGKDSAYYAVNNALGHIKALHDMRIWRKGKLTKRNAHSRV